MTENFQNCINEKAGIPSIKAFADRVMEAATSSPVSGYYVPMGLREHKNHYIMKITKADLNTPFNSQLPIDVRDTNGHTNVVLALWKDCNYTESNTYIPKWHIVNAIYYNANRDKFEGWIDLEDQLPPKEFA